ncbi:MAG TPA: hypothetical protein VHX60_04815 [Acidobacteriaceae bacterium]|nr:hypothetical protein [Acidobacteriaceae bacterium]
MTEQTPLPKVFVDFNNSDRQGRVRLNTVGTIEDLSSLGIILHEGAKLILCSFELESVGTVTYSAEEGLWVAGVEWNNIRKLPGNDLP